MVDERNVQGDDEMPAALLVGVLMQVDLAQINLEQHLDILADVEARARGGRGSIADVQQTQARVAAARAALAEARRELQQARAFYERLVGYPPAELDDPDVPAALLPATSTNGPTSSTRTTTAATTTGPRRTSSFRTPATARTTPSSSM